MKVPDARRPKALDEENRELETLLAEAMLDVATLREAVPGIEARHPDLHLGRRQTLDTRGP